MAQILDNATSVSDVMVVYKLLSSSQWESEVWKQEFFSVLDSVSAVREVKHKHHNHLILDSAKEVNDDILAFFFFVVIDTFLVGCC